MRGDKQFLETPFYGVRQMTWHLRNEDHLVNEKRIRRLMRLMPIYQKPNIPLPLSHMLACVRGARLRKAIRFTPICCVGCAWIGPTKSGAPTSPIYRCGEAFCI